MKLIIDIPEEIYRAYKDRPPMLGDAGMDMIAQAIANGTPLDKIRAKIEESKTVRVTTDDAMIEASADAVINPQYRNFTNGLDMAIYIIDHYQKGAEK